MPAWMIRYVDCAYLPACLSIFLLWQSGAESLHALCASVEYRIGLASLSLSPKQEFCLKRGARGRGGGGEKRVREYRVSENDINSI